MNDKKLRDAVLSLSPEDRAGLAHDILKSLDGPSEPDAATAWLEEIEERAGEIADGSVRPVDWDDARRRIRQRLNEKRG